jgi:DUF1365 family protein
MIPGPAAVCRGDVYHRRNHPVEHEFHHRVSYVWLDPDHPQEILRHHRLWSDRRLRPIQFRRSDYGIDGGGSLGGEVRRDVASMLFPHDVGSVRMLTQLRRWGWLFNPITVYLIWAQADSPESAPRVAVLEVTNTPWKERHRYVAPFDGGDAARLTAQFDKELHVSPFIDASMRYRLTVARRSDIIDLRIDVMDADGRQLLETALLLDREPATPQVLARSLWRDGLSTLGVSSAIHLQAARLLFKRVPFVPHPSKRRSDDLVPDQ